MSSGKMSVAFGAYAALNSLGAVFCKLLLGPYVDKHGRRNIVIYMATVLMLECVTLCISTVAM